MRQAVAVAGDHEGAPRNAVQWPRAVYHGVKGPRRSPLPSTALRSVAGASLRATRHPRPATKPCGVPRRLAVCLVGQRGRAAACRAAGSRSLGTVGGRKRLADTVPPACRATLAGATALDRLTVSARAGRLRGRVVVTLTVPDPAGVVPVGLARHETNALVAVAAAGRERCISGRRQPVANTRTRTSRRRIQRTRATRQAAGRDTRRVRRVRTRRGRQHRTRTRTFCQTVATRLVRWAPADAVLVLEDLALP